MPSLTLKLSLFIFLFGQVSISIGQVQKARLPNIINVPTKSHIYPSLTSDESYMVFYSNYSNTRNYELKYSKKIGKDLWTEPEYIEGILKPGNDHFGSFSVSPDGQYLLFSSYRANGIGKYDVLISKRNGDQWSTPMNPGKPLNSPENDGNPSMSPDGKSIYFMRCTSMDETTKSGCRILVSHKKSKTIWGEPEELPSYINSGNTTSPRILSDNQTLIYSSEVPGNMGKLDLYMTRIENGVWSQPIPYDIINSVRNDEFVSVPARGDIIYYTDVYKDQFNIVIALLPQELRPKKVLLLSGEIKNRNSTEKINIQAYDAETGQLFAGTSLGEDESEFELPLPEGKIYDFSIFPLDGKHTYYSNLYNLKYLESSNREKLDFTIDEFRIGATYSLDAIEIDTVLNRVSTNSDLEFRRLIAVMQRNPSMVFEIHGFTNRPMEIERIEHIIEAIDSSNFSTDNLNTVDTYQVATYNSDSNDANDEFIDLEEPVQNISNESYSQDVVDTSQVELKKVFITQIEERVVFDPARATQEKAEIIINHLISKGVPPNRLKATGIGYSEDRSLDINGTEYWFKLKIGL